jgi:hypothetical protein
MWGIEQMKNAGSCSVDINISPTILLYAQCVEVYQVLHPHNSMDNPVLRALLQTIGITARISFINLLYKWKDCLCT